MANKKQKQQKQKKQKGEIEIEKISDKKVIENISANHALRRFSGSGNICVKCGKVGHWGSISSFKSERYNYLICGHCKHVQKSKKKLFQCTHCKSFELTENDLTVYHRGCRLRNAFKHIKGAVKANGGYLMIDMNKVKQHVGVKHGRTV